MIAARRSLFTFSVDRLLNFTWPNGALKPQNCTNSLPLGYFKCRDLSYSIGMDSRKNETGVECSKKLRTVNPVWRPINRISTQASSSEEYRAVEVTDELEGENQVKEVHCCTSTKNSSTQGDVEVASAVTEITKFTASSSASQETEDKVLGGESVIFTEKHSVSVEMQVGASLLRFIKGKGGSTQKLIEDEMGVKIQIPSSKKEDSIIIEGFSIESISRTSEKIQSIIDEAVKSPNLDYSHFISLPLAIHPELVDKLINFQNSILRISPSLDEDLDNLNEENSENEDEDQKLEKELNVAVEPKAEGCSENVRLNLTNIPRVSYAPKSAKSSTLSDLGIEKSLFIKPETFHLTVLMLKLWNKDQVHAATEILQNISSEVMEALDNRPLSIRLKGLSCMRGSFAKAGVLYAPVEEIGSEGRLLRACQVIIDAYVKAGLVLEKDVNQKLKLHATVMNARHRKRKGQTRKFSTFDARGIVKQYGNEEWGEYLIREAHLSQRFVFDDKGYYHCCASIPFPARCK